jgi:creatinine amidohydrolase/Fe(II)-dependent formamide hydrolase-like protein
MDAMRRSHEVYGFITDVTELCDDGWFGNPTWATPERAEKFTSVVADGVLELLDGVMKARDIRRQQQERE